MTFGLRGHYGWILAKKGEFVNVVVSLHVISALFTFLHRVVRVFPFMNYAESW